MAHEANPTPPQHASAEPDVDVDPNLLEQAWLQHLSSRQMFSRDVTIGLIAIILLTVLFVRIVGGFEKSAARVQQRYATESAYMNNDMNRLSALSLAYFSGQQRLFKVINEIPCAVRERTDGLRVKLMDVNFPLPRTTDCTEAIGASYSPDLLARLAEPERKAVDGEGATIRIPSSLLYREAVAPINVALQQQKDLYLDAPVRQIVQSVKDIVSEQQRRLSQTGPNIKMRAELSDIARSLDELASAIDQAPFSLVPTEPYGGFHGEIPPSVAQIGTNGQLVDKLTADLLHKLDTIDEFAAGASHGTFMEAITEAKAVISEARSSELLASRANDPAFSESSVNDMSLSDDVDLINPIYAGPLPSTVTIRESEFISLFPLGLAVALAYFVWRYAQLRHRADDLNRVIVNLGLSEFEADIVMPHFGGIGGAVSRMRRHSGMNVASEIAGAACVLGVGAAVVYASRASIDLRAQFGDSLGLYVMYGLAALLLLWAYLILTQEFVAGESQAATTGAIEHRHSRLGVPYAEAFRRAVEFSSDSAARFVTHTRITLLGLLAALALTFALSLSATELASRNSRAQWPHGSIEIATNAPPPAGNTLGSFLGPAQGRGAEPISGGLQPGGLGSHLGDRLDLRDLAGPGLGLLVGNEVSLLVKTTGYEGQSLHLRWSLISLPNGHPDFEPLLENQPVFPTSIIVPRTNTSANPVKVWIPCPPPLGLYEVAITLAQDNGTPVGTLRMVLRVTTEDATCTLTGPTRIELDAANALAAEVL